MSETMTSEELQALNQAFHLLARNLFIYSMEGGVFTVVTDKDREIGALREEGLERTQDLLDKVADLITGEGEGPSCGNFREEYTYWAFLSETAMLPHYLAEVADHRRRFIALRNRVTSREEGEAKAEVVAVFDAIIAQRTSLLERLNAAAEGVCAPVAVEDAAAILDGKIKVNS